MFNSTLLTFDVITWNIFYILQLYALIVFFNDLQLNED